MTGTITYLDDEHVTEIRITDTPHNSSASGYGRKMPTSLMLKIGTRWHRVYVMRFSNSGTAYVVKGGDDLILESATEHRIEAYERAFLMGTDLQPVRIDRLTPGDRFRFHHDGVVNTLVCCSKYGRRYTWTDYQGEHYLYAGHYALNGKTAWPYVFPTEAAQTEVKAA